MPRASLPPRAPSLGVENGEKAISSSPGPALARTPAEKTASSADAVSGQGGGRKLLGFPDGEGSGVSTSLPCSRAKGEREERNGYGSLRQESRGRSPGRDWTDAGEPERALVQWDSQGEATEAHGRDGDHKEKDTETGKRKKGARWRCDLRRQTETDFPPKVETLADRNLLALHSAWVAAQEW